MASEEAPDYQSDDADDLIVTREPLDTAMPRGASPLGRLPRGAHATPSSAAPSALARSLGDISEAPAWSASPLPIRPPASASIGWEHNLTLRQKAQRGGGIALLIALTLYLLLGGPVITRNAAQQVADAVNARLHPPKPLPTLAERGYIGVKSPPGAYNLPEISVAPASGQANAAWACWATPYSTNGQRGVWTAHAFYTATSGDSWSAIPLPETTAQGCSVSADGERAGGALFVLAQGLAPDGSCMSPYLYLTSDAGHTLTHVPWPISPSDSVCQFSAALHGGAIYIWSHKPLLRDTSPNLPPTGRFIVSRDAGRTWTPADNGLDDSLGLDVVGFRPGGHIIATIADVRSAGSSLLMTSDDFGASWRSHGDLPGAFPQLFVSNDDTVTDHGGWGRIYELAEAPSTGSPAVLMQRYLATAYLGQAWRSVPLPPAPTGAEANAQSREPLIVGLGPAGSLEVERGIVESANAQLSPSRRLWVWNPNSSQWLLDPQAVPGNLELQGATWRAGDQIIWMTTLQLGVPPVLQIYTKVYPANFLERMQSP